MSLPRQRLTITVTEYKLLRPGLDVLANGFAGAKAEHFPNRHPWHLIDWVASNVYRSQAYADEMAVRMIRVRRKLWDLNQSRKIRIDAFELPRETINYVEQSAHRGAKSLVVALNSVVMCIIFGFSSDLICFVPKICRPPRCHCNCRLISCKLDNVCCF